MDSKYISGFRKTLSIQKTNSYGAIRVFFNDKSSLNFGKLSLTKFMALSHVLENDIVAYDFKRKILITPPEEAQDVKRV